MPPAAASVRQRRKPPRTDAGALRLGHASANLGAVSCGAAVWCSRRNGTSRCATPVRATFEPGGATSIQVLFCYRADRARHRLTIGCRGCGAGHVFTLK